MSVVKIRACKAISLSGLLYQRGHDVGRDRLFDLLREAGMLVSRRRFREDLIEDVEDLERELGIGKYKDQKPSTQPKTTQTPSTTTSASAPLTFKGIPITGSSSAFGSALVKAGFKNAGNGTYTGDFAGYSNCKVTPAGNPVQEVRIDFPVISDWDALEKAYDNLQADLTRKYGIDPIVNRNLAVYNLRGSLRRSCPGRP